jgi:hypothetical protein
MEYQIEYAEEWGWQVIVWVCYIPRLQNKIPSFGGTIEGGGV